MLSILLLSSLPVILASQYKYYNYGAYNTTSEVALSNCDYSVVKMSYLSLVCDSPYTFYYGNGANRNSPTCDYGDKATLYGEILVVDDLQDGDSIYITLAAYDDNYNLLATISPTNLCDTYVGKDCTRAGTYRFADKLKFEAPDGAGQKGFYPAIRIAFSTAADSGYNLGAVNTKCPVWDQNNPSFVDWTNKGPQRSQKQVFFSSNGMLIATCVALAIFTTFIWTRAKAESESGFSGRSPTSREVDLMELS